MAATLNPREFRERLQRRARRAGISIDTPLVASLDAYYRLLATWNAKINLTGIDLKEHPDEAFDRLLIEPVVAARHIPAGVLRLLDVGSGGGSPAIPMKLASPSLALTMVESKTRKSVFLREAARTLGLSNTDVKTARFEELLTQPTLHEAHDAISIRAVRIETRTLMGLQALLRPGGVFLLFRGRGRADAHEGVAPLLAWRATYPLVEMLGSRLVMLEKRGVSSSSSPHS